jgi:integrase
VLPGVHRVRAKLAKGVAEYWYAWRGGPRILSETAPTPGALTRKVEKAAAKAAETYQALRSQKPSADGFVAGLIYAFQASPEFANLAARTQADLRKHLSVIRDDLGDMPVKGLEAKDARKVLLRWRADYADKPRTADHYMSALAWLLTWARDNGHTNADPLSNWTRLYSVDRSEIVWEPTEIEALCAAAEPELQRLIMGAVWSGLRRGDLLKLTWSDVKADFIIRKTAKRKKTVRIPILPQLRAVIEASPKVAPVVFTKDGKPWNANTLSKRFALAREQAIKVAPTIEGKRWHDMRGSFATYLVAAGLDTSAIAEIMGWAPEQAEATKRSYIGQGSVALASLGKLKRFTGEA